MEVLDLRTLYLNYTLLNVVNLLMMIVLWKQSGKRFQGTHFFLLDYALQIASLLLIYLRGSIPDFFSIVISLSFSVSGTFFGLIGLAKFTGKKVNYWFNIFLIVEIFVVQFWFSEINNNLAVRNYNFSVVFLILSVQCAVLMLFNVPVELKKLTIWVGSVFTLFAVLNLIRIITYLFEQTTTNDYMNSGTFESVVILTYQILFSLLTFSLILMINGRLHRQVIQGEEKFSKAFQSAPYAIVITKMPDGKITEVNEGFYALSGYSKNEVLGKTTRELGLYKNSEERDNVLELLKTEKKIKNREITFSRKSGELLYGLVSADVIEINNEVNILTTIYDLTPRKELENQLVEMNATKDKFFSIIAHDLKNPVSNVLGFSNLLAERLSSISGNEIEQFVSLINLSAKQTLTLLENLLQWAMMQQGNFSFEPKRLILNNLVADEIAAASENANKKGILITNFVSEALIVTADENMLKTTLRNLFQNAVKFTKQGGKIEISASESENGVQITVADNGVGIDETNIRKLFDIGSGYTTRGTANEKGTGLGLILCKEFIELHKGKIWVESQKNQGSTFHIILPVAPVG